MFAQQGLFSVWRPPFVHRKEQLVDRRPLNEVLEEQLKRENMELTLPFFYKITLQLSQAPELFKFLLRAGVTAAKLFPGYGGAARAVDEWSHRQWMDWKQLND